MPQEPKAVAEAFSASTPVSLEMPEGSTCFAIAFAAGLVLNLGLGFNPGLYMLRGLAPWLPVGDYAPLSR